MTEDATKPGAPSRPVGYAPMGDPDDVRTRRVSGLISGLLRWGVRSSLALFIIGTVIGFARGREHGTTSADLGRLTGGEGEFPREIAWLTQGLRNGRGTAMVVLGLVILISTPVLRVALSLTVFAAQRDRAFVVVTAAVLLLLMLSFILGSVES